MKKRRKRKDGDSIEKCEKCEDFGHKMLKIFNNVVRCGNVWGDMLEDPWKD